MCKFYYKTCKYCREIIGADLMQTPHLCGNMPHNCTFRNIIFRQDICMSCFQDRDKIQTDSNTEDDKDVLSEIQQNLQILSNQKYYHI